MITLTFLFYFAICFNQMLQVTSQECQVITTTTTKNCGENNAIENLPNSQFARGKKGPKGEKGMPGQTGEKGNPGNDCNVTQISELQQKVEKLQKNNNLIVEILVANLLSGVSIGNCIYKFTDQGDFNQARSECKSYGGDLIHRYFGAKGAAYHDEIRAFVNSKMDLSKQAVWIGYTDVDQEGEWKLMDGELYDAGDRSEESIYYWGRGAPNNWQGIQHCAMVDQGSLNDVECSKSAHGSRKLYGLCEVCQM